MTKITKRVVDAATAKAGRFVVWDEQIMGFGLKVLPSGGKVYIYNYRTPEGRGRRIVIGRHGEWTPTQARARAEEYRQVVRNGGDPLGEKRALLEAATVGELLDEYLKSESFKDKAASTQAIDRGRIERHLRPLLGRRHAHLLTDNDIKRALSTIRDGGTVADIKTKKRGRARVKGGAGTARMAIDLLRVVFNFAIHEGLAKVNPCVGVKTGASGTRDAILEDAADYARLFQALDRMERELRIRPPAADAIRLVALVGCRRGEATNLRWRHVEPGRIVLPPREHKTGRKTAKPRVITLPAAAQAIIARQPEGEPDAFVFAPSREGGAISLSKVFAKVRREAQLPAAITLHSLRHSVASHLAMGGAEASQIMTALGQNQLSTVARYIHFAKDAREAIAEQAAAVALAGMAAASGKPKARVTRMKGGK